jgi:hypothetical protein
MEIKWTDEDPETGQRRILCADRFARVWRFRWKAGRRTPWEGEIEPTRAMWEHVLDSLKRRYQRREGVEEEDIQQVAKLLQAVIDREAFLNGEEPNP